MRRLVAPLALLILFAMGGTASAHVTNPGFSEVRQHGTHVNYVLGLETERAGRRGGREQGGRWRPT